MDKIKNIISDNKDELKDKQVSTQPIHDAGQEPAAEGISAFNTRGAPPALPQDGHVEHEGSKEERDKLAQTMNAKKD